MVQSLPWGSKLRWAMALLVAALWSDILSRDVCRRLKRALTLWFGKASCGERWANHAERERRLAACRRCPVFYAPLQTCGTPLKKDLREVGCWCNVEAKTLYADAKCWGDEQLGDECDFGWRAAEERNHAR